MNRQLLAMLMVVVAVLAFTGVASAATQQVLVKDAWDEEVLVSEAYDEEVLVSPAWNETVFDHYLVNGEYTVFHPAVYETVHHPAVYETVHHEAVYEYQEVAPAYNESVEADHTALVYKGVEYDAYTNAADQILFVPYISKNKVKYDQYNAQWFYEGFEAYGFRVLDDVGCGHNHIWQAVMNTIEHPAVFDYVLVQDAYDEEVLVSDAYDEQVVVSPEAYEQVPYTGNGPYYGTFPDWNDIDTWAQWIYSHPGATGGWGSWIPYYALIEHTAVFELVHHDAVYETLHHAAEYMDIVIPDPIVPIVSEPVTTEPVVDVPTKTIPMQETGVSVLPLGIAALLVFLGLALVGFRRRDE